MFIMNFYFWIPRLFTGLDLTSGSRFGPISSPNRMAHRSSTFHPSKPISQQLSSFLAQFPIWVRMNLKNMLSFWREMFHFTLLLSWSFISWLREWKSLFPSEISWESSMLSTFVFWNLTTTGSIGMPLEDAPSGSVSSSKCSTISACGSLIQLHMPNYIIVTESILWVAVFISSCRLR